MSDLDWHDRMLALAKHVATWSKDPSTKVGCVIVDDLRRVRALGYNGFPRGILDDGARYADRPTKYSLVVHAEANALLNALGPVDGCILYSTLFPCGECAKLIIQAGLKTVFHGGHYDGELALSQSIAWTMLREAGVTCVRV